MKEGIEEFLFQEKPVKAILALKKAEKPLYAAIISKEIDSTYAHTLNVLSMLKELKLVSFQENGRIKQVFLTEVGLEVAKVIESLSELFKLSELEYKLDLLYEKEIKGKLREDIDKKTVVGRLDNYKGELERIIKEEPQNIAQLAEKLFKKADLISREVTGSIIE
jgi:predicted transcriptional regulator